MKTQVEQIKEAKRAYIMPINGPHTRFCIYLDKGKEGLDILWPSDTSMGRSKQMLPYQIYSKAKSSPHPAYHFHLKGYGYDKVYELTLMLRDINPGLKVFDTVPGWIPRER